MQGGLQAGRRNSQTPGQPAKATLNEFFPAFGHQTCGNRVIMLHFVLLEQALHLQQQALAQVTPPNTGRVALLQTPDAVFHHLARQTRSTAHASSNIYL